MTALVLAFAWFALILVVAAFLELAATSFARDPAVAMSAVMYTVFAIIFGFLVYGFKLPVWLATLIFVPLLIASIFIGNYIQAVQTTFSLSVNAWRGY